MPHQHFDGLRHFLTIDVHWMPQRFEKMKKEKKKEKKPPAHKEMTQSDNKRLTGDVPVVVTTSAAEASRRKRKNSMVERQGQKNSRNRREHTRKRQHTPIHKRRYTKISKKFEKSRVEYEKVCFALFSTFVFFLKGFSNTNSNKSFIRISSAFKSFAPT